MAQFKLKDCFICNFCRNICEGKCHELKVAHINKEITEKDSNFDADFLTDRKQIINCLGDRCDRPCKLQDKYGFQTLDKDVLLNTIKFLGNRVNQLIEENNKLKQELKR